MAVELARKIFGELRDKNVLLVGRGEDERAGRAARWCARGARATVLGGRTFERASGAGRRAGRARGSRSRRCASELAAADIVISGTGAPGHGHPPRGRGRRAPRAQGRHRRPLFLIDIAVPRDIEPSVAKLGGVFLYDLDDLRAVAEANLRERMKEAAAAEALVDREVRQFLDWLKARDAVPLAGRAAPAGGGDPPGELDKARRRMGPLTPEQEEALEAATTAIVNKLLHSPDGAPQGDRRRTATAPSRSASSGSSSACERDPIRIGTRGSALALWQADHVAGRLRAAGPPASRSSASRPPATACSTGGWRRSGARRPS